MTEEEGLENEARQMSFQERLDETSTVGEEQIAQLCHEVNRVYCKVLGDDSQPSWEDAPDWQKESAIKGVNFHLENPSAPASSSHDSWLAEKREKGWKYGPVKDPEKKEHPCYVPFEELPTSQKVKDFLFKNTVHSFSRLFGMEAPSEEKIVGMKVKAENRIREIRVELDLLIKSRLDYSAEVTLSHRSLQLAKMWLGKVLQELGTPNPYPESTNVSNEEIADEAETTEKTLYPEWERIDASRITKVKHLRGIIEEIEFRYNELFSVNLRGNYGFFLSNSITALSESKMWLGQELGRIKDNQDNQDKSGN